MRVFGIVGWKNTGKTGMVADLVSIFSERGYAVSTVKHAHHDFDIDQPGRDSYRHREAGAREVLVSSANRWALMHEMRGDPEATFDELLTRLSPVDLILVEGFKTGGHHKIELVRTESERPLISEKDPKVVAIASDGPFSHDRLPVLDAADRAAVADFIARHIGLAP